MASENPNTIILRDSNGTEFFDAPAGTTITPGMVVDEVDGLLTLAGDGAKTGRIAVLPDGARKTIDDDYAVDEQASYVAPHGGNRFYSWVAAGESVQDGDPILSDGAGAFRSVDSVGGETVDGASYKAIEDVDNSGGGAAVRLRVERQ